MSMCSKYDIENFRKITCIDTWSGGHNEFNMTEVEMRLTTT